MWYCIGVGVYDILIESFLDMDFMKLPLKIWTHYLNVLNSNEWKQAQKTQ